MYKNKFFDKEPELQVNQPEWDIMAFATNVVFSLRRKFGFNKMLSEIQFKYKIKKLIYITFYWVLFSVAQDFYDILVLSHYSAVNVDRYFALFVFTNAMTTMLGGLIGGSIIIFYLERIWRTKPLAYAMGVMTIIYTGVNFFVVGMGSSVFQSSIQGLPLYHPSVLEATMNYFFSPDFLKNYLTWWIVSIATIVLLQVNDKYGPGVLLDLILGNYHKPKSEYRIFMFLDLRSSTTTAERLGGKAYLNYIQDFFMDTTDAILETKGEIYQYVGDEIVLSWKMKNGIEQANALRCFFSIQQAIEKKSGYYKEKYNYVPGFKAGIHSGKVTAGEIGIVKKDITFSGDVLNTTSRIQQKCNEFGFDLLISNDLLRLMPLGKHMISKNIGEVSLKGKKSKVAISTVKLVEGQPA